MKCFCVIFSLCLSGVFASYDNRFWHFQQLKVPVNPLNNELSVQKLLQRLLGSRANRFIVKINPNISSDGRDVFNLNKPEGSSFITVTGSSPVAAAWGSHHYLKHYCNCHVSWDGDQLQAFQWGKLPAVNLTVRANDLFRYYQNVCTYGYSFVWWNETRWTREIDWMALNGYNMALSFVGMETVWKKLYIGYGLTEEEIDQHFSGPAFLPWQRMGNMRGWGGPLDENWLKRTHDLQIYILSQMRSLGITPVLPAFVGHVPRAFKRIFPDAKFSKATRWNDFNDTYCCPLMMDPTEPLFAQISSDFTREIIGHFGTNHVYNGDPFNEIDPDTTSLTKLAAYGRAVYESLSEQDPKAIWMVQAWTFHHSPLYWTEDRVKAFLTSVPKGKMLLLDLMAELVPQYKIFNNFYGHYYIWCMLHNFGGTLGLHGSVQFVNNNTFEARDDPNSTMIGTGITPEGINQNYVVYDLMSEMSWRQSPTNLTEWFSKYAQRRYGEFDKSATTAWILLYKSVYSYTGAEAQHGQYIFTKRPHIFKHPKYWYEPKDVWKAWYNLLRIQSDAVLSSQLFRIDLVDVSRQSMQLLFDRMYMEIIQDYNKGDKQRFSAKSEAFLDAMNDLDTVLGTAKTFLLGPWIEDAKSWDLKYESNAKNQITLWGPRGEILDYATKQWSGIVKDYYKPRWSLFFKYLSDSIVNRRLNMTDFEKKVFSTVELPFTTRSKLYPTQPSGDTLKLSTILYDKWKPIYDHVGLTF